jgi:signal transduction histidine kinase
MSIRSTPASSAAAPGPGEHRRLLLAYAGLCGLCWTLYAVAITEWQRGSLRLAEGIYEASWNLWPAMGLGLAVLPWVRWLQRGGEARSGLARTALHVSAAVLFSALWQLASFALGWALYGREHAGATAEQRLVWQSVFGVFVYGALVLGFGGALHARRASAAALAAARAEAALALAAAQAESAMVRAELAAISGKLNPHFLFNTLNSLRLLTLKDPAAAEQSLLRFARMMRYVLDTQRGAADRVPLQDELDFVRDYLALEALRLGPRLRVEWQIDPATLQDAVPPLTLQPLVENSINHGIAPRLGGGTVRIESRHQARTDARSAPPLLALQVADDGEGCVWPRPPEDAAGPAAAPAAARGAALARGARGVGLSALLRRFELDYEGRARLAVQSAPGAGFRVDILIPLDVQPA